MNKFKFYVAGALSAVVVAWLGIGVLALTLWLLFSLLVGNRPNFGWWGIALLCCFLLAYFIGLCLGSGVACAFFWHRYVDFEFESTDWALLTSLFLFSPLLVIASSSFTYWFFLTLAAIFPFVKGVNFGMDWWPRHRWRYLFGLSNDWECDDET